MKRHVYTPEQIEWLKNNTQKKPWKIITLEFNSVFNTSLTMIQLRYACYHRNVNNGLYHAPGQYPSSFLFTKEEEQWIKENYKGLSNADFTELFNKTFKKNMKVLQLKAYKNKHHLISGLTGRFEKGIIPHNKGKKMDPEIYKKIQDTFFKTGQIQKHRAPLYSKRKSKGYWEIKVRDGAGNRNWMPLNRWIWEQEKKEKLDPEDVVIFLDGNEDNNSITNLYKVSKADLVRMNHEYETTHNPELKKLIVLTVQLKSKMRGMTNESKN